MTSPQPPGYHGIGPAGHWPEFVDKRFEGGWTVRVCITCGLTDGGFRIATR